MLAGRIKEVPLGDSGFAALGKTGNEGAETLGWVSASLGDTTMPSLPGLRPRGEVFPPEGDVFVESLTE